MAIMTFGYDHKNAQTYDVVRVGVVTRDGKDQEIELITVPSICDHLTTQPIDFCVTRYPHLSDLDLADSLSNEGSMEVDLLIGSDFYQLEKQSGVTMGR